MIEEKTDRLRLEFADSSMIQDVYRLRHRVYSDELGQYETRVDGILPDIEGLDCKYISAYIGSDLVGFVGVTLPGSELYSVDRYLDRSEIPFEFNERLFEVRALTVEKSQRGSYIAAALMYAAFRVIESHGGERIIAIGRRDVLAMYLKLGLKLVGKSFSCGPVTYDLLSAEVGDIASKLKLMQVRLGKLEKRIYWSINVAFQQPTECYHGGAFFDAVGDRFDHLDRADSIINADVLDAWFDPAPEVQHVFMEKIGWKMRTSPPTHAGGLEENIAQARGVCPGNILAGSGSSSLMYLAFRNWLDKSSRVLILDPTYGEYAHIFENVIKCKVDRFILSRVNGFCIDTDRLVEKLGKGYDLFVWVNPNSPTGRHVERVEVEKVLLSAQKCKRVWIDETYIEYAGRSHSMEKYAVDSENVIVCKSMSKVYALSGMRVAYLCGGVHHLEPIRLISPPWSVSLPGQIAASYALLADSYYDQCYRQTHQLRDELVTGLYGLGLSELVYGVANMVLLFLREGGKTAAQVVDECRVYGLYLRDVSAMGVTMGNYAVRVAVKDAESNRRIVEILAKVLA